MERIPAFSSHTLMGELGNWNRLENSIKGLSKDGLESRRFQKLKLAEYERMWNKYRGTAITIDERAYLVVVDHHRRKLEKALYPGLITRAIHRLSGAIKRAIARQAEARKVTEFPYEQIPLPSDRRQRAEDEHQSQETSQDQQQRQRRRYGQNLGQRLRGQRGNSQGPRM